MTRLHQTTLLDMWVRQNRIHRHINLHLCDKRVNIAWSYDNKNVTVPYFNIVT